MADEQNQEPVKLTDAEAALLNELETAQVELKARSTGALMMAIRSRGLNGYYGYRAGYLMPMQSPPFKVAEA